MAWQVGVSCADITPPLHIPELGFIPRQHRFQGVHDPLFAKALASETNDGAAIIVTADVTASTACCIKVDKKSTNAWCKLDAGDIMSTYPLTCPDVFVKVKPETLVNSSFASAVRLSTFVAMP